MPGSHGSGPLPGVAVAGVVQPPIHDGGPVVGGAEFPAAGDCRELGDRVGAVRGKQQQMGAEGGPGRFVGETGHNLLGRDIQRLHDFPSGQVFGGHLEGVDVLAGGVCEPDGRVMLVALQGGGGQGRIVAGQDPVKQLGRGGRVDRFGPDEAVRVAVSDELQVEVVGDPASGQHGVQLLPGFLSGDQAVHGVGGDPLRGVHGGGVAQLNGLGDVAGGQPNSPVVAVVPHRQATVTGDFEYGPPVAVLHPVTGGQAEDAVVGSGDDLFADASRVAVGQHRHPNGLGLGRVWFGGEPVVAGALVELADQLPGGGEHDRIEAAAPVGLPGREDFFGERGEVADMHSSLVEVEAERFGPAVAEGEGGGAFGGVGEPVQLSKPDRSVGVGDVAEHPASADRGELLVVTDQPNTAAASDDEIDGGVQGQSVGHPGLVDHHQGRRPNPAGPAGQVVAVEGPGEFGEGVGDSADLVAELRRGGRRWR
jgi:hypothetical protein